MNVVEQWERKAMRAMRKGDDGYYQKAMAYCDCIYRFTYDEDRFDCFDRLRQLAETPDYLNDNQVKNQNNLPQKAARFQGCFVA